MLSQYYSVDIAGNNYLDVVLGAHKDELDFYCLEKAEVTAVDYSANTITISSEADAAEYQDITYACHTDIDYYAYGLAAAGLPAASSVFNNSARCFLYDNDTNKVFAFMRTDPDTGAKTCEYAFPCISKQDRLGGDVYATCGSSNLDKTLEGIPGRTYWPYFMLHVTVDGVTYIITIINLDTGEELKTENTSGDALVTFPCAQSELSRHFGMRVQTWPLAALQEDWVSDTVVTCPGADVTVISDTDVESTNEGTYPGPLIGTEITTTTGTTTCDSIAVINYTDNMVQTIVSTAYGASGFPSSYFNKIYTEIGTTRDITYNNWYHTESPLCATYNAPNGGEFRNTILDTVLENLNVTDTIEAVRDYYQSKIGWPVGYEVTTTTDKWTGENSYQLSGTYTNWNLPGFSKLITVDYQYQNPNLPTTSNVWTKNEEIHGNYAYLMPNKWQLREPLPTNSIPLFERWYGYLTNWVFCKQTTIRNKYYDYVGGTGWTAWEHTSEVFSVFDVVPQLYLASKRDTDSDSELAMDSAVRVHAIASVISARTKTFISDMGFTSADDFGTSIDFENDVDCDLYYAKYDMNAQKYMG